MSDTENTKVGDSNLSSLSVAPIAKNLINMGYKKKYIKSIIQLLLCTVIIGTNVSYAETIFSAKLVNKKGTSTSQPLEVLAVKEEQGADDKSNSHIEFAPNRRGYQGIFTFNLPVNPNEVIQSLILRANYRGPQKAVQTWGFKLLNVQSGKWVDISNNGDANEWTWSDIVATVKSPSDYINNNGQITLSYSTNNNTDNSQLDFLAFDVNSSEATPKATVTPTPAVTQPPATATQGNHWQPVPGLAWQIQYAGSLDTSLKVDVFNLDLFDTPASTISKLRADGKHVICYFSAGSYENWRPDTGMFPEAVLGRNLDGWAGEKWLDVRQLDALIPIMKARMQQAADKGCDGVDPDNVDGYSNNTGFTLSYDDQLAYNKALADEAHKLGLAISLKNDLDQIKDLVTYFDFAVNEECFEYSECDLLKPFVSAGKAVFGIEYNLSSASFCPKANASNFDFLKKNLSLDAARESCR